MSRYFPLLLFVALPLASALVAQDSDLKTDKQKQSYALGMDIAQNLKQAGIEVDLATLASAMSDVLADKKPKLTEEEMAAALQAISRSVAEKRAAMQEKLAKDNLAAGKAFFAKNKTNKGVTELESGLQVQVLKSGTGASPKASDTVKVHYKGTLLDGTVFDSTDGGPPAEFGVGRVIPGWTEALQRMKPGDKWKLFIPPSLAYGEGGSGPIPPNSVLTFEVELLEVVK